jgi:hypothetical protein
VAAVRPSWRATGFAIDGFARQADDGGAEKSHANWGKSMGKHVASGVVVAVAAMAIGCAGSGLVRAQPANQGSKSSVVAVELTVSDYNKWLAVYDGQKSIRDGSAITNSRVFRGADNPNEILVWNETADSAKTREGLTSTEMRKAMQQAGIVGAPRIYVVQQ